MSELITFGSGLMTLDRDDMTLHSLRRPVQQLSENAFNTLDPLAVHLGELVAMDVLIDSTNPGLNTVHERYIQSTKVARYIIVIRHKFDLLVLGSGATHGGLLENHRGKGYRLLERW